MKIKEPFTIQLNHLPQRVPPVNTRFALYMYRQFMSSLCALSASVRQYLAAGIYRRYCRYIYTYIYMYIYIFCRTLLLSSFWTSRGHRCRPFFPPVLAFNFSSCIGFSNPTARRFSSSVTSSRSRIFRKSIFAQEKVPTNLYEYALGGIRTHETDLYQARG